MAITLERLADSVFLYTWEGIVTAEDIRANMLPTLKDARYVVLDISRLAYFPFEMAEAGIPPHRKLHNLDHVFIVHHPAYKTWAKMLLRGTLRAELSYYTATQDAIAAALTAVE